MNALLAYVPLAIAAAASGLAQNPVSAATVSNELSQITLDPAETFHVRELQIRRGGVSFYFTDGLLSLATAVRGKRVAAVFTTAGIELGDGEVVLMPPQPAERHSLASFARSPNLDEHFRSVIFYFTDDTADELLSEVVHADPERQELNPDFRLQAEHVLRSTSAQVKTRMIASILDPNAVADRFFYSSIQGRTVGDFDILYNATSPEPVTVGRVSEVNPGATRFELWANYRPKDQPVENPDSPVLSDYSIDATIDGALALTAMADFDLLPNGPRGRVVSLDLSDRLHVAAASVDGHAVEVFQQTGDVADSFSSDQEFLLVSERPLTSARSHHIEVRYSGTIISQTAQSSYLVAERNLWYPHTTTMLTKFDLVFHCPERFDIVSSGELVDDRVQGGVRTVHRRTTAPEQMAGFNLGQYDEVSLQSPPYRIHSYEDKALNGNFNGIPQESAEILQYYTSEWIPLLDTSLSVTPVPGDFGQGFPGLIYLARTAYIPELERPATQRTTQSRIFFSNLLLPHELAHQWWGNMVTSDNYRSEWLMEAMANESALEFISAHGGSAISKSVIDQYRSDLAQSIDGKPIESDGPVDFGVRILTTSGLAAWQTILYKKGTWILEMLRHRMGDAGFTRMQADLLRTYSGKPLSNEAFREMASRYIPGDQPDKTLELFFDTWVYGTGIPRIGANRSGTKLHVSGVTEGFAADLPLHCRTKAGAEQIRWVRIEEGETAIPSAGCKLPSGSEFLYLPQ